jgi:hypothetical protein
MQQSLLQIVQTILSAMDSDEVASINDTVESYQLAVLLRQLFYDIAVDLDLREHENAVEIESSLDPNKPNYMKVPSNVSGIRWIKYDNRDTLETTPNYQPVEFMEFQDFLRMTQGWRELPTSEIGVATLVANNENHDFIYKKNKHPQYFTTLNGSDLYFDSFNNTVDTTLQKSKTMCFANAYPQFLLQDSFIPKLDPTQFSYFINKGKARAFAELKQMPSSEAQGEARRQKIVFQARKNRTEGLSYFNRAPKYGRK